MARGSVRVNGKKIRQYREQRHALERAEFAAKLGVSAKTVYEIEHGRQTTRPSTLRKIARILGVSPFELVATADDDPEAVPA